MASSGVRPPFLPEWAPRAFCQITDALAHDGFPCIFARKVNSVKSGWVCFVDSVESRHGREEVRSAVLAYLGSLEHYPREKAFLMPLLVVVRPVRPPLSHGEYSQQAWNLLQHLHDNDPEPWPADVPTDRERDDWSFCFGGEQVFSNVSHPAHRLHRSRNLGDSLTFVMQPRKSFDLVAGSNHKGRVVRSVIRARAARYEGQPASADLGFFGTPGNREWRQMAAREGDEEYPATCPLKIRRRGNTVV